MLSGNSVCGESLEKGCGQRQCRSQHIQLNPCMVNEFQPEQMHIFLIPDVIQGNAEKSHKFSRESGGGAEGTA